MAIRATHLAFGNLVRQGFPRHPGLNECADIRSLITKVIEVQDCWIRFTAVHAWMSQEVRPHPRLKFSCCVTAALLCVRDLPFSVPRVPLVGVGALAKKANPLPRLAAQRPVREFGKRFGLAADSTSSYSKRCLETQLDRRWSRRPWSATVDRGGPTERGSLAGFSSMAVRATHFALCNLSSDARPCAPASGVGRDVRDLVADVIELEYDDVSLAAVHAWVLSEVVDDLLANLRTSVSDVFVDPSALALPVGHIVPRIRIGEAVPTPGLEFRLASPDWRELVQRLHFAALRARSHEGERADRSSPGE